VRNGREAARLFIKLLGNISAILSACDAR